MTKRPARNQRTAEQFALRARDLEPIAERDGAWLASNIANQDRAIIPFLGEPVGRVFEKAAPRSKLVRVTDWNPA